VLAEEVHRLDPADEQVAGVQAPAHVGVRERALDVGGGLDQRSHVRVQDELEPLGGDEVRELAEARAGAALANVGFVPLNVLSQAQVGKLTEQLGLLPDPGILVYVRPARLAVKISGFADKETVAQAAQNASQPS
jgi:hypothetical protein